MGPRRHDHRRSTAGRQTLAGLIERLPPAGLSEETAKTSPASAVERGEVDAGDGAGIALPDRVREKAHEEALSLASAVSGGRTRIADMVAGTTPPLRTLYEGAYGDALRRAHLEGVDLLANFPVATWRTATRGATSPGAARLVPFRERGHLRAYASLSRTEALFFRLDPLAVHSHLLAAGHMLDPPTTPGRHASPCFNRWRSPGRRRSSTNRSAVTLLALIHSFAHRTIRRLAAFAGIERDALAEYLLPHHLAFIVYAASRENSSSADFRPFRDLAQPIPRRLHRRRVALRPRPGLPQRWGRLHGMLHLENHPAAGSTASSTVPTSSAPPGSSADPTSNGRR